MKFIPYIGKIEIEPIKKEGPIMSPEDNLLEAGRVIALGDDVITGGYSTASLNTTASYSTLIPKLSVGDIVYFDSWGCVKTAPDSEGNVHYIIPESPNIILGYEKYDPQKQ